VSRTREIEALRSQIEAVRAGALGPGGRGIELAAGAMRAGALHEWLGVDGEGASWTPPVCLLVDAAARALAQGVATGVVWVGRACWPYAVLLEERRSLLRASIFVDPPDAAARVWCLDVAGRGAGGEERVLVIGDGRGLTLAQTRRLQLSAAAGGGACVVARPGRERSMLSAATTRWVVARCATEGERPRWAVTLGRSKEGGACVGVGPALVEWDGRAGAVAVHGVVGERAGGASAAAS
jgi:hypothetical protein